jgi:hypothetical protein
MPPQEYEARLRRAMPEWQTNCTSDDRAALDDAATPASADPQPRVRLRSDRLGTDSRSVQCQDWTGSFGRSRRLVGKARRPDELHIPERQIRHRVIGKPYARLGDPPHSEDAHYARKVEIRSRKKGYSDHTIAW